MPLKPSPALKELFKAAGMADQFETIWKNYRLIGTQTDFIDPAGNATLLGNSRLEEQFKSTSSCITCHSRSTIKILSDVPLTRLQPHASPTKSFNGLPSPCWFLRYDGLLEFRQLDFVWSLWRAKSKITGEPFDRKNFVLNDCSPPS
jgi:hypothetical protein